MKYYLDTNTCVDYLRGEHLRLLERLLSRRPDEIAIPSIVKAELLYGARKSRQREKNEQMVRSFLLPYEVQPFGDAEAEAYGRIRADLERKGEPIGPNDLIVAATVAASSGVLVTNNYREFRRVPSLRVQNWTR